MTPTSTSRLPTSFVTRVVPRAAGSDWSPGPDQGVLLWDTGSAVHAGADPDVTPTSEGADLHAWVTAFAQAVVEVVAGHRPPGQLVKWTSREVYRDLERRTRLAQRAATAAGGMPVQRSTLRPHVRSVHLCPVASDVTEASVHVRHGRRSRALAMRFEVVQERWRCTAVEFA